MCDECPKGMFDVRYKTASRYSVKRVSAKNHVDAENKVIIGTNERIQVENVSWND